VWVELGAAFVETLGAPEGKKRERRPRRSRATRRSSAR
jgi:hypothetical protein